MAKGLILQLHQCYRATNVGQLRDVTESKFAHLVAIVRVVAEDPLTWQPRTIRDECQPCLVAVASAAVIKVHWHPQRH